MCIEKLYHNKQALGIYLYVSNLLTVNRVSFIYSRFNLITTLIDKLSKLLTQVYLNFKSHSKKFNIIEKSLWVFHKTWPVSLTC